MFRSSGSFIHGRQQRIAVIFAVVTGIFTVCGAVSYAAVPGVTTTVPVFGTNDVSATAPITATFSEAMDPASLTTGTFTVSQFTGVRAIAAGFAHTLILKNDGTVIAWGNNSMGQATVPVGLSGADAIAAGESHSVALKNDGTVVAWGRNDYGQTTAQTGLAGVTAIAAGFGHTLALKNDGTVKAWGLNASGQTTVPAGLSGVVAIAAGSFHSLALKSDGTVVAWGRNDYGQAVVPESLSGVTSIAAGWYHSIALKSDGTLMVWGDGISGLSPLPDGVSGLTAITGGGYHKLGLTGSGTVVAWDYNNYGQTTVPGNLTGVISVAAGAYHSVALKSDGTAIAWGRNHYNQAAVPVNSSVTTLPGTVSYNTGTNTAVFTPTGSLPSPTVLTATLTSAARSQSGVNPTSDYSWSFITGVSPSHYILSVILGGTGYGSVHSDAPGNIACSSTPPGTCSGDFSGTVVNLTFTPDWKSLFSGWGNSCSGYSVCRPYMDKNRIVTAFFVPNKQAIVDGDQNSGFATLQEAYNGTPSGKSIQAHVYTFYEDVIFGESKDVTLDGGKDSSDSSYQNTVGFTTVQGSLTLKSGPVGSGKIVIKNVIIKSKP